MASDEDAEILKNMADPLWRLSNLYWILTKGDDGQPSIVKFTPNDTQLRIIARLWHRNVILKARQLGCTTLICLLWLDHALFNANQRCGVIAQDKEAAETIFKDKVKFAYDRLPDVLKREMPLERDSATQLKFSHNNSSIRVATSMRASTIHRLLISEFGKICAKSPDKAKEITTGSLQAVPKSGITVVESTAEGQDGDFYRITQIAEAAQQKGAKLTPKDYRFHFYPWWRAPEYTLDPDLVIIRDKDVKYFHELEAQEGITLSAGQQAWYVATRKADFADEEDKMWQEYPSTAAEAFQRSTEGTYYAAQLASARKERRITTVPFTPGVPVNTFWDIGNSDGSAIWLHQRIGLRNHFIGFVEGWGESYSYFVGKLQATGYVWGKHYLPHDGGHVRQGQVINISPKQMLENLGLRNVVCVPVVSSLQDGIQLTRDAFNACWFDETACAEGITHLQMYRKRWNTATANWSNEPLKDVHTEAADAFRQWAQGYKADDGVKPKAIQFASEFG
jgi:hypothetical protein